MLAAEKRRREVEGQEGERGVGWQGDDGTNIKVDALTSSSRKDIPDIKRMTATPVNASNIILDIC